MIYYVKCDCGGEHRIDSKEELQALAKGEVFCPKRKSWQDCWVMLGIDEQREYPNKEQEREE